jgi:DNA-binding transcriptional ArsR family regulator
MGLAELRHQLHRGSRSGWAVRACRAFPVQARPLLDLVPPVGPWPAFLDPVTASVDEGLEIVASTPRSWVRHELAASWRRPERPPTWLRALADGDREAFTTLAEALNAFYLACVAPHWQVIINAYRADMARRADVLAQVGLGEFFGTLHQDLTWQRGSLVRAGRSLQRAGRRLDLRLDGAGLQMTPSVLWTGPPLFAISAPSSAVSTMIYPAWSALPNADPASGRDLTPLMGRTRAAVLRALRVPCGTAELAARIGISAASASEHAAALRAAELIETERHGREVRHSLTSLGRTLLDLPGNVIRLLTSCTPTLLAVSKPRRAAASPGRRHPRLAPSDWHARSAGWNRPGRGSWTHP